jgi:hypothetical protein
VSYAGRHWGTGKINDDATRPWGRVMGSVVGEPAGAWTGQTAGQVPSQGAGQGSGGDWLAKWVPGGPTCPDGVSEKNCIYAKCKAGQRATAGAWERVAPRALDQGLAWIVPGMPASYSTGLEAAWKETISAAVPPPGGEHSGNGLLVDISIPLPTPQAPGADLDNLLDPVFSAVINGQGWFGGRRSRLRWVAASKLVLDEPGLRLALLQEAPDLWRDTHVEIAMNAVYQAEIPTPKTRGEYEEWVGLHASRHLPPGGVGVALDFSGSAVNLGDIATGIVKPMIDGLWPILGGDSGAPHDGRVAALRMRKGVTWIDGTVAVKVVGLAR